MLNYLSSNKDRLDHFDLQILSYLESSTESVFSSNSIVASLGIIIGLISKLNQSKIFTKLSKLESQIKSITLSNQVGKFRNNK